jgi:hypothetical protein
MFSSCFMCPTKIAKQSLMPVNMHVVKDLTMTLEIKTYEDLTCTYDSAYAAGNVEWLLRLRSHQCHIAYILLQIPHGNSAQLGSKHQAALNDIGFSLSVKIRRVVIEAALIAHWANE